MLLCFVVVNSLQWRHNEHYGVLNHQRLDRLLNSLFRSRSKKTPQLRVTGLGDGKSTVTGDFPAQRANNAENASIWWRHDVSDNLQSFLDVTLLTFDNIRLPQCQQYYPNNYEQMDHKNKHYKELDLDSI